ncbi:hypothetical protein Q3O60_02900 [Alkalimonas collagenimarina]|uniref:XRE family transcriptional regulator n=1 Tax=Alkalimonas collagenimarina TaxID=400390 RepID=A0ABT9GW90_9GAMM|nr:hypothetical protein [Alkalimonas collagenimarina]MDP4535134.1 hypothetical protein [Alkalimonas collagenimarina]
MSNKTIIAEEKSLAKDASAGSNMPGVAPAADSVRLMLMQRDQMMAQLRQIDEQITEQLTKGANNSYQPLSQTSIKQMMEQNIGSLKVAELCMVSELAPATYYNALSKLDTVKVGSIQRLLNAVGLDLFIGKKINAPVVSDRDD